MTIRQKRYWKTKMQIYKYINMQTVIRARRLDVPAKGKNLDHPRQNIIAVPRHRRTKDNKLRLSIEIWWKNWEGSEKICDSRSHYEWGIRNSKNFKNKLIKLYLDKLKNSKKHDFLHGWNQPGY